MVYVILRTALSMRITQTLLIERRKLSLCQ